MALQSTGGLKVNLTNEGVNYAEILMTSIKCAYSHSPAHSHAVSQAGLNTYAYDQNGNIINCTVGGVVWTYTYNAKDQLTAVRKNNQLVSEYGYDGDGKRVWAKDYEGYDPNKPKVTTYIGNHYEVRVEGYRPPAGGAPAQPCSPPSYRTFLT